MRDEYRLLRDFERIKGRSIATVGDVDDHAQAIHPCNDGSAEVADAVVVRLRVPVADRISSVIGDLGYPLTHRIESVDVVNCPEMLGVLQTQNHADSARAFDLVEEGCGVHAEERVGMRGDELVPLLKEPCHGGELILTAETDTDVKHIDA